MTPRHVLAGVLRRGRDVLLRGRHAGEVVVGRGAAVLSARGRRALPPPPAAGCTGGVLNVMAHPDDDLFFVNPDLLADLQAGTCTTTVYVTSGDSGQRNSYHRARERGIAAAYAQMTGEADVWARTRVTVAGHVLTEATLAGAPFVRLYFLRLPDGGMDGRGWPRSACGSLRRLVEGQIPVLWTVDTPAQAYTAADVVEVLSALMAHVRPTAIRTLDGERPHADGDHSDHHTVARLTAEARTRMAATVPLTGYVGYPSAALPVNVSGAALAAKTAAVQAYARHDRLLVLSSADGSYRPEAAWLPRRHRTGGPNGVHMRRV